MDINRDRQFPEWEAWEEWEDFEIAVNFFNDTRDSVSRRNTSFKLHSPCSIFQKVLQFSRKNHLLLPPPAPN